VTAVRDRVTGGKNCPAIPLGDENGSHAATRFRAVLYVLIPVVLALFIFAHGCHVGDHDDEPSLVPWVHDPEPSR